MEVETTNHEITSLDCAIKACIQDLWKCKTIEDLQNANNCARSKVAELRSAIDSLETIAYETDDSKLQKELKETVNFHREQLLNTQSALRKGVLAGKQEIDANAKKSLFQKSANDEVRLRKSAIANRSNVAKTGKDLTQNLLSISRAMHNSVQLSSDTLGTIITSSKTINNTNEDLKDQFGHIKTSHNLLTKYNRRECTDKVLIFLALLLFFSTVLYILKKRLFPL